MLFEWYLGEEVLRLGVFLKYKIRIFFKNLLVNHFSSSFKKCGITENNCEI